MMAIIVTVLTYTAKGAAILAVVADAGKKVVSLIKED